MQQPYYSAQDQLPDFPLPHLRLHHDMTDSIPAPPGPRDLHTRQALGSRAPTHTHAHTLAPPASRPRGSTANNTNAEPHMTQHRRLAVGPRMYVSPDTSPIKKDFTPVLTLTRPRNYPLPRPVFGAPPGGELSRLQGGMRRLQGPPMPNDGQYQSHREVDPFYNPVLQPRNRGAPKKQKANKGNDNNKKGDGKQPTFLTKLYAILIQPEYHHIIRWDEKGEVIIIERPDELADKVLPLVYRQSRFASFSRQLNIYGWMRKVSLRHVESGIVDPDASTWSHPFLRRSSTKEEILGFKRRVPPRLSQAAKRRASLPGMGMPDMHSPSSGSDENYHSPPDPYQHHLLDDLDEDHPMVFPPHSQSHYHPHPPQRMQHHMHQLQHPHQPPNQHLQSLPHIHIHAQPLFFHQMPRHSQAMVVSPSTPSPLDEDMDLDPVHRALRPIPVPVPTHRGDAPSVHDLTPLFPHSAPAQADSFPLHVTRGHFRTRSVQGEPPSASMLSVGSPFVTEWDQNAVQNRPAAPAGQAPAQQVTAEHSDIHVNAIPHPAPGQSILRPSYEIPHPSTWAKRGFTDFNGNAYSTPFAPSSLPANRASPGSHQRSHQPMSMTKPQQDRSYSGTLSDDSPMTVSPGVYQAGHANSPSQADTGLSSFGLQPYPHNNASQQHSHRPYSSPTSTTLDRNRYADANADAGASAEASQEARGSNGRPSLSDNSHNSPYSPRSRSLALPMIASRTLVSRRNSLVDSLDALPLPPLTLSQKDGGHDLSMGTGTGTGLGLGIRNGERNRRDAEEEGLPSASLKGLAAHSPFEGILPGEGDGEGDGENGREIVRCRE